MSLFNKYYLLNNVDQTDLHCLTITIWKNLENNNNVKIRT